MSELEQLRQQADPANRPPSDVGYRNAVAMRKAALELSDNLAYTQALIWEGTHLRSLGRYNEVLALNADISAALAELGDTPEALELEDGYLWYYTFACADAGEFTQGLTAVARLEEIATEKDDPDSWVREKIAKSILFDRMGNSIYARSIVTAARAEYRQITGREPKANLDNALLAIGLSHFNRTLGLITKQEADELLAELEKEGNAALAREAKDNVIGQATIRANLSELYIFMRRFDEAYECLKYSLKFFEESKTYAISDWLYVNLAKYHFATSEPAKALELLAPLYRRFDYDRQLNGVRALRVAAQAAKALGKDEEAYEYLKRLEMSERRRTTAQLEVQSEIFMSRLFAEAEADRHRTLAEIDPLTKLGNRRRLHRAFADLVPEEGHEADRFSIAILDIDHFKPINDRFGHAAGDSVLIDIAELLIEHTRSDDIVIRLGGEEFMIIFPNSGIEAASAAAENLGKVVSSTEFEALPEDWRVTMSIGIAAAPPFDGVELIAIADHAMYEAKRAGRNNVVVGDEALIDGERKTARQSAILDAPKLVDAYVYGQESKKR